MGVEGEQTLCVDTKEMIGKRSEKVFYCQHKTTKSKTCESRTEGRVGDGVTI